MTSTRQVTTAIATRTFAVGNPSHRPGRPLVHDPASGLTHLAGRALPPGRLELNPAEVATWPLIHPADLERTTPISVRWQPLDHCDLRCPHCLDATAVAALTPTERGRIASVLGATVGLLDVDIAGGEPLQLADIAQLADQITCEGRPTRRHGARVVSVTTNGWLLAERADELTGHVDAVRLSLDGPTADSHDHRHGAGSFYRAMRGARVAIDCGIPLQVQTVLMRSTRAHGQGMVNRALALGAVGLTFLQPLPDDAATIADVEQLTDDEARDVVAGLEVPAGFPVRLRTRGTAGGLTVVRADGEVWRHEPGAGGGMIRRALHRPADLAVDRRGGSA